MKSVLFILLILISYKGFAQNTIEIKEVDQAFDLIFANPDAAIVALNTLEQQTKNQNDSLYGIVLNHKGVYYAVNSDLEKAIYYFFSATKHLKQNSEAKVNARKNKAVILKNKQKIGSHSALKKDIKRS